MTFRVALKCLASFAGLLIICIGCVGCGQQHESLTEAKALLKSDKRNRIELAVRELNRALEAELTPRDEAEARYLLGYYDPDLSAEERTALFSEAARLEPRRYEEALIHEALRDRGEEIREAVREALALRYPERKEPIRRELLDALKSSDNRSRADAAWVLGYLAAQDTALHADLNDALSHKRMETRLNAVAAVAEMARRNPETAKRFVPSLLEKIEAKPKPVWWKFWNPEGERETPETRAMCVRALGEIGAVDELLAILRNKGSSLRSNALQAVAEAGGGETAVDALLEILKEDADQTDAWTSTRRAGRAVTQIR